METNHTFSAGSIWLKLKMDKQIATYDLYVREMPPHRNFMLFGGLEEMIQDIKNWKYTPEQINYLVKIGVIGKEMKFYLKNFKFTGSVSAMPEGTVFFPGETIVRVTAPIVEASLFTMYLMNVVTSHTIFLSKAVRSVMAAQGKIVLGGGCRAHSFETNAKATRAMYLAGGGLPTTTAAICYKYKIPIPTAPVFLGQHAYIKSFGSELEAMQAFAKIFPDQTSFMIDTYNIKKGLANAINVAQDLKKRGHKLRFVVIDSGDLSKETKIARRALDKAGLKFVKIFVAGNLDEYKLEQLAKKNIPADVFHVITELNTSSDAPKLEIVYKLAQLKDGKKIKYTAKLAPGKLSLPGEKQVFRVYDKNNVMRGDYIGLSNEKLGQPLLKEIFSTGKLVYRPPSLEQIRAYIQKEINTLSKNLRSISTETKYPVVVSENLKILLRKLIQEHSGKESQSGSEVFEV